MATDALSVASSRPAWLRRSWRRHWPKLDKAERSYRVQEQSRHHGSKCRRGRLAHHKSFVEDHLMRRSFSILSAQKIRRNGHRVTRKEKWRRLYRRAAAPSGRPAIAPKAIAFRRHSAQQTRVAGRREKSQTDCAANNWRPRGEEWQHE